MKARPISFSPFGLLPLSSRLAVECALVLAVCLTPGTSVFATTYAGDKVRSRAERALREGEFELAEKLFRELITKNAHDTDARLGLSFTLLKQRNLLDAYDQAARVLAADPLSARGHALLGSVVLASGDFRLSVEEFRTALSLNEREALAVAGLAMVDFYEGRTNSSLSGLRRAASIDPGEPDYAFSLAQAAARTEHFKEAADAYERFLVIAPRTDSDRRARIRGLIDFLRYLGTQSTLYVHSGEPRATVPVDAADNRPVLEVRINGGREPLRFVLDTGSGMSVISEETARRLAVRTVARGGLARAVGGGGRFDIAYGFLASIDIGEARVQNVPVYIRRFFDEKNKVDGYLGTSAIAKFRATVDYGDRSFTLVRQRGTNNAPETPGANSIEIPVRTTSSGFLSGEVYLDGISKPLNFIIDTGATISVVSEKLATREEMSNLAEAGRMRVYGAAGVAEDVKMLLLPHLRFGACERERIHAAVLDLEPINETAGFVQAGIIGGNFLRHFRVTFDFQRGIVRLEPLTTIQQKAVLAAPAASAMVKHQ